MTVNGNKVTSTNVLLVRPFKSIVKEALLGLAYKNGVAINVTIDDIDEGYLYEGQFIKGTTYNELVTSLIRTKYTLDDELALQANYRLNTDSEEEQTFQEWRSKCKEIAKSLLNG